MLIENILARCKERNMSVRHLEQASGLANGTIMRWDKSSPRVDSVQSVAKVFGCSVDDLLKEEGGES